MAVMIARFGRLLQKLGDSNLLADSILLNETEVFFCEPAVERIAVKRRFRTDRAIPAYFGMVKWFAELSLKRG